jgi:spermidine synthase
MNESSSRAAPYLAGVAVLLTLSLVLALGYRAGSARDGNVVFEGESSFGRVWVVERADGLRSLYMGEGRARQSAIFPGRPRHLELPYTRVATIGLALTPADGRILFVGLGGGAMPMFARQVLPEARIDVVEIDPLIVEVAHSHFGFQPDSLLVVHTTDGRAFIEEAPLPSYDLIVLDAFSDDEIPLALATRQFLESVRDRLAPDGVVVSNLWSANRDHDAMLATYQAVFQQVHLVRVPGRSQRILIAGATREPLDRPALVAASRLLALRVDLGFDLPRLVSRGYQVPAVPAAPVLEDQVPNPAVTTH